MSRGGRVCNCDGQEYWRKSPLYRNSRRGLWTLEEKNGQRPGMCGQCRRLWWWKAFLLIVFVVCFVCCGFVVCFVCGGWGFILLLLPGQYWPVRQRVQE